MGKHMDKEMARPLTSEERVTLDNLEKQNRKRTAEMRKRKTCSYCRKPVSKDEPQRVVPAGKFHERCWEQRGSELDREIRRQMLEAQGIDPDSDSDEWEGAATE